MYDREMTSFLFSLRNPHGTGQRKFPLRPEGQRSAIVSYYEWGPTFGKFDLYVSDESNQKGTFGPDNSTADFGTCYANTSPHSSKTVFTGGKTFCVKDIEVFEIR
jgi:hypothetical protein